MSNINNYSPDTEISIVWNDRNGVTYDTTTSDPDHIVKEEYLFNGGKSSILTISSKVTKNNNLIVFACNTTVGNENFDIDVYLNTFRVHTQNLEVGFGQTATLSCSVDNGHISAMEIRWFEDHDLEVQGIQREITKTDNFVTTISELVIKEAKKDNAYTCQVRGTYTKTFSFDVELLVNDIVLSPQGQIRAFHGTVIDMVCSFQSTLFWEGSFDWNHKESICHVADHCRDRKDTPVSSALSITVTKETAGKWSCSFTKFSLGRFRKMISSPLDLRVIELRGTQSPAVAWGRVGDEKNVTCRVPVGLTYSSLSDIEWTLNGYTLSEDFTEPTQTGFTFAETTQSDTELTWTITLRYSAFTEGDLVCRPVYSTGEELQIPSSRIHLITLTSDKESVTVTPSGEGEVTFITQAEETPSATEVTFPGGVYFRRSRSSKKFSADNGGVVYKEVIAFIINQTLEIKNKSESEVREFQYTYRINPRGSNEMFVIGKVFLVGETFVDNATIWVVIGGRVTLTVYFTALDLSYLRVAWERQNGSAWSDIMSSRSTRILMSDFDDKNMMFSTLVIDKMTEPLTTLFRAKLEISGNVEISDPLTAESVNVFLQEIAPVFEGESVSLTFTIFYGPRELSHITLVHQDSGTEIQIETPEFAISHPLNISHELSSVFSCDQGYYFFTVVFKTGLKLKTNSVMLEVKKKCRPLEAPANTMIREVNDPSSHNYKVEVICKQGGGEEENDFFFMDEERTEVWCDTSTGLYSSGDQLSPCVRVFS